MSNLSINMATGEMDLHSCDDPWCKNRPCTGSQTDDLAKPAVPPSADQVFAWCEAHDSDPAEGWLVDVLNGTYTLDEMRAAVLEGRRPVSAPKRKVLVIEYDVTDLNPKQIDRLMLEAVVQAEASDDDAVDAHPDVPVLSTKVLV
jgi:hypothetical protein